MKSQLHDSSLVALDYVLKRYPLFDASLKEGRIILKMNSFTSMTLSPETLSNKELLMKLDEEHSDKEASDLLNATYMNLKIAVHKNSVSIWVRVNGRDSSAVASNLSLADLSEELLHKLNEDVSLASNQNERYFFCSYMKKCYEWSELSHYCWASTYSKEAVEKNPALLKEIQDTRD